MSDFLFCSQVFIGKRDESGDPIESSLPDVEEEVQQIRIIAVLPTDNQQRGTPVAIDVVELHGCAHSKYPSPFFPPTEKQPPLSINSEIYI